MTGYAGMMNGIVTGFADLAILVLLIAASVVDIRRLILPDSLTVLIALCAALSLVFAGPILWADHLLGAVTAFVLFEGTRRIMTRLLQREAMGFGDVKLMTAGGLWIGSGALPVAILTACVTAALGFVLAMIMRGQTIWRTELPFGPFLAIGLVAARLFDRSAPSLF